MKSLFKTIVILAFFTVSGYASSQEVGGYVGFYMPPTIFSMSANGGGSGQFSHGTTHSGYVGTPAGSSSVYGNTWMSGSVYMPNIPNSYAFSSGSIEGGSSAGHFGDRNNSFSDGSGWMRSNASVQVGNGGSASSNVEGFFGGSSSATRPTVTTTRER